MQIVQTTLDYIREYRSIYLNSLPEFQELFLEIMISESEFYLLVSDNVEMGYAIKNREGVLIEFHVLKNYLNKSHDFFRLVVEKLAITEIYCKSFDPILLSNCLLSTFSYSVIGVLYRDYIEPKVDRMPEISMVKADLPSTGFLLSQDDSIRELFETGDQLEGFIQNDHVFKFYIGNEFIGCGMIIRTNKQWDYCDLGVWVDPQKRGNSFGSQIILSLREFAIQNNMKPSCGCAIDNLASRGIIEKSGFVSRYKMIHFKTT